MGITVNRIKTIGERVQHLINTLADGKNTIFAAKLGINEANVRSYLRGTQPKADILEKIVITYEVNAHWLLTGYGEVMAQNVQPAREPFVITNETPVSVFLAEYIDHLDKKDEKIVQQAQEIGRLQERVRELEQRLAKTAGGADICNTANVG